MRSLSLSTLSIFFFFVSCRSTFSDLSQLRRRGELWCKSPRSRRRGRSRTDIGRRTHPCQRVSCCWHAHPRNYCELKFGNIFLEWGEDDSIKANFSWNLTHAPSTDLNLVTVYPNPKKTDVRNKMWLPDNLSYRETKERSCVAHGIGVG